MSIRRTLLFAIALGGGLALAGPAMADPPDHAPAHGYRAMHRYVYYPEREIYYAPESRLWFWIGDGDWRFGASLPIGYQQYTTGGVSIELGSERPYTEHVYVTEKYGKGPKRSKQKHRGKHHD